MKYKKIKFLNNKSSVILISGLVILVMANLSALIDYIFHPEIHYFDKEHLTVGAFSALITTVLFYSIFIYTRQLKESFRRQFQSESALRETETHYKSLYNNTPLGIYQTTPEGKILRANQVLLKMLEFTTLEELQNRNLETEGFSDSSEINRVKFKELIECNECVMGLEEAWVTRTGKIIYIRENAWVVKESNGDIICYEGIVEDITERKKAEELLRSSEKKYRELFDHSNAAVIIFEPETEIVIDVNKKACTTYGFSKEEFIGMNFKNLSKDVSIVEMHLERLVREGSIRDFEATHYNKERVEIEFLINASLINYNGNSAVLSININISEQKKINEELIKAKEEAEEMNRLKSSFLAQMSHELRTPLVGILGYAEMISAESGKREIQDMANIIKASGDRLNDTLTSILDLSKLEAEEIKIKREKKDIVEIITECKKLFEVAAQKKGLWLEIINTDGKIYAPVNKNLLIKIINNLLSNAIKYTTSGGVFIKIKSYSDFYRIEISDTGVGIAEDKLDIIFEPFRQVSEGLDRDYEGAGLGLTLVKKMLYVIGGKISVLSQLGRGSTFCIELPMNGLNGEAEILDEENKDDKIIEKRAVNVNSDQMLSILLVEDDEINASAVKLFLKNNYNVEVIDNGAGAIKLAKEKTFSAILMDITLKGKFDGLQTTREIKKLDGYADTPVIALTAHAMPGDREKFIKGGCTHYLSKPFKRNQLISLLQSLLALEEIV